MDDAATMHAMQLFLTHVVSVGIGIDFPQPDPSQKVSFTCFKDPQDISYW